MSSDDISNGRSASGSAGVAVAPSPRHYGLIRRGRLVDRLIESRETPVVLIDAPAGFGKSTVLGEWEEADQRPFAWLTLGDRHDDPVLLTASIAGAVADLAPVDERVYSALYGSRPGTLKVAIPRLLESLRRSTSPIVLALDDVHALRDRESLGIVAAIADGLPGGSQLALASRTQPSIRLNRLRANRGLTELNAKDLAMTHGEADDLLRACGLRLQGGSVELLVHRTEGWPAALYLAALSLSDADDADEAAHEFAGDDRMVADYLRDEFISSLAADELDFLTRTAILDEVSGELCDATLGAEGSAEILHRLARSNALVTAIDSKERVFRYHALLREMLASELHRLNAREERELQRRAGDWFARRGDFDRAVPHAIAGGDVDAAAAMIWSQSARYASVGREATLERWLESFSAPQIDASPQLCLVRATCAISAGDGAAATHWTERVLTALEGAPAADAEILRVVASAIAATGGARDGVVRMRTDAVAAFAILPEDDPWRSACRLVEGASLHLTGDPAGARVALEDGARRGAVSTPSIFALCSAQLALLAEDEGDLADAMRLSKESLARIEINALADQPAMSLVFAVGAMIATREGEAGVASGHLRHATTLLGRLSEISSWYEVETRIVLARAGAALDDVAGARAQLADAGRRLRLTKDAPILREWLQRAWKEADSATVSGRWPLSPAELRLLHQLPTHLTFREIAAESFVSANTVKTQARSIYRKLGVASRAEAVATARTAGLLDGDPAAQPRGD